MSTPLRDAEREKQLRAHLREIDDRLENAIRSRNEYFDYLKSKYPTLTSDRLETSQSDDRELGRFANWDARGVQRIITRDPTNPDPYAHSMLILTPQDGPQSRLRDDLKTNVYHWDIGRTVPSQRFASSLAPLPRLSDPIPSNGMIINSDLPRIRARLAEIKSDLTDLRDQRMFMSSADYHRTILSTKDPFISSLNVFKGSEKPHQNPCDYATPNALPPRRSDRSFAEILNKLTEMTEEMPMEEISLPMPSISEAPSQKDAQIDRMFEKMRHQLSHDPVEQERPPTSPAQRSPKESVVKRSAGIKFEEPMQQSPKASTEAAPAAPSYNQILASMERPKAKVESSSDSSDSDEDAPRPFTIAPSTSTAPPPAHDDFLARFLGSEKKTTTGMKTAPPIDLDDDDFY